MKKKITLFTVFTALTLKIELRCILVPLIILEMFLQLDWPPRQDLGYRKTEGLQKNFCSI